MSGVITLLVVDDNPGDVRFLVEGLRRATTLRFDHHRVHDGSEALDFLQRVGAEVQATLPDLVLLDLHMPRMDGHECLAAIKADPRLCRIPVIVLTASAKDTDKFVSHDLQADDHFVKPRSVAELDEMVRHLEAFCTTRFRIGHAQSE